MEAGDRDRVCLALAVWGHLQAANLRHLQRLWARRLICKVRRQGGMDRLLQVGRDHHCQVPAKAKMAHQWKTVARDKIGHHLLRCQSSSAWLQLVRLHLFLAAMRIQTSSARRPPPTPPILNSKTYLRLTKALLQNGRRYWLHRQPYRIFLPTQKLSHLYHLTLAPQFQVGRAT
jgi:hypothetical protein